MPAVENGLLHPLPRAEHATLRAWFLPDRPGPLAGLHAIDTGLGHLWVDRWPAPRVVLARAGIDHQLAGAPDALTLEALRARVERGTVAAPAAFAGRIRAAWPDVEVWERVIQTIPEPVALDAPAGLRIRRLEASDARALETLPDDLRWIYAPWTSAAIAARSGLAFGAFDADGALLSVVTPFHVGDRYEDVGVVTVPEARGRGAGAACASRVVADIASRGRTASWSTTPDNAGSLAIAAKLGARFERDDVLYLVGEEL